jgi:tRNA (mo5U34)-methyltransferase
MKFPELTSYQLQAGESLRSVFSYHHWRHRIPLGDNLFTPATRVPEEWDFCLLPKEFSGKSFLDVGANDGMFSFMAERAGASKVVAIDHYREHTEFWDHTTGWNIQGIRKAKEYLGSKVEIRTGDLYEAVPSLGKFDYVWFSNVMSWLPDPLRALEILSTACNETLHIREDMSWLAGGPLLELVRKPGSSKPGGYYWPNREFMDKVLQGFGFRHIEYHPIDEDYIIRDRYTRFPRAVIPEACPIYATPFEKAPFSEAKGGTDRVNMRVNGFVFVTTRGWFREEDLSRADKLPAGSPVKKLKSSLGSGLRKLKKRKLGHKAFRNFVIIAKR